jgi:hypothetical protein
MKHLNSGLFWISVISGYILWAIDFLFISKPDSILPDLNIFSAGIFASAYILNVFAGKIRNSKSLTNKVDKKHDLPDIYCPKCLAG